MRKSLGVIVGLAALLLAAPPALAQGIDGSWCRNDQRLTINGRTIMTPGGGQTQGENGGDAVSRIVPPRGPPPGGLLTPHPPHEAHAPTPTTRHAPPPIS